MPALILALLLVGMLPRPAAAAATPNRSSTGDSSWVLRGGEEGTAFRSLTVEGEDRIQFEFERPALRLDLDPNRAPGLEWGTVTDVLDRSVPDLMRPLLQASADWRTEYTARPWLDGFASGVVARFEPQVQEVERWKLVIADSRGETVRTFAGQGRPPKTLAWDGSLDPDGLVVPGLTYSYVFEAFDRAGNKRNFVGPAFRVSAFRLTGGEGMTLLFSAEDLAVEKTGGWQTGAAQRTETPALLLEAASWLNQMPEPTAVRIVATARRRDAAEALADRVAVALDARLLGDPGRLSRRIEVRPDAPPGGAVRLEPLGGRNSAGSTKK